jgi:hypothetical protein
MKHIGVGGAQIFTVDQSAVHGPVKFMSQQWRDLVHHALAEANRLGLEISMEGCDGWSESGGPWITPDKSMQTVVFTEEYATGGQKIDLKLPQPAAKLGYYDDIALLAWPTIAGDGPKTKGLRLDQLAQRVGMSSKGGLKAFATTQESVDAVIKQSSVIDLTGKADWDAPAGNWTIVRFGHTSTGQTTHPSTAAGLECDKLSKSVVQFHVQSMYGPVMADSPDMVGKTFAYMLLDSWECGCENWTPTMRDDFKARRGYDLWAWLPALTGRVVESADATERFQWDLRRTIADLLTENHYGTFAEIAHEHHMGLMSEASGIGMPTIADQLACKGRCDVPMGEFWVNKSAEQNIDDPKEAASAAHIYGKPIAATESFTSVPGTAAWKNDPYSLKALGDWEFCLGVNRFIFHRYAHQPWLDRVPGMSMGPWGINFERTNTWWNQASAWMDYLTRCQYLLQQGRFVADLCYFYGEGAPVCVRHGALSPQPPSGFDYDVCNAEVLLNSMTVEDGQIALKSGMRYRILVLPPDNRLTLAVAKKVAELVKAGATVYGPAPAKSPSLADGPDADTQIQQIAQDVWGNCDGKAATEHACGKGKVLFGQALDKALAVPADFHSSADGQCYIHRVDGDSDIYFVSNQQHNPIDADYSFRVSGKAPELWHADTGAIETPAIYQTRDGVTTLPIHLDPSGSVFVIFGPANGGGPLVQAATLDGQPLFSSAASAKASADLPVVRDGKAEMTVWQSGHYSIIDASGGSTTADIKIPAAVGIDGPWQLSFPPKRGAPETASFDHLMSWTDSPEDGIKYFSGTATYQSDFTLAPDLLQNGQRFKLDLGDVKNIAEVSVNGKALGILWKAPFVVDITDAAKAGANHLEIKVTNLWPNRLIGDLKLPETQRITWASVNLYKRTSPLLPSGLIGPVTVEPGAVVQLIAAQH